jgi:hypothetical protein
LVRNPDYRVTPGGVPQNTAANEAGAGRIRVVLGVSGQWQGNK